MYYAMQNALLRRIFPAMCTKEKIPPFKISPLETSHLCLC